MQVPGHLLVHVMLTYYTGSRAPFGMCNVYPVHGQPLVHVMLTVYASSGALVMLTDYAGSRAPGGTDRSSTVQSRF